MLSASFFVRPVRFTLCCRLLASAMTGVRQLVQASPVVEHLKLLHQEAVQIIARGSCLARFELKEQVAAGDVSSMYTVAETLLSAGGVVNP